MATNTNTSNVKRLSSKELRASVDRLSRPYHGQVTLPGASITTQDPSTKQSIGVMSDSLNVHRLPSVMASRRASDSAVDNSG
eukprot:scaffold455149_cov52-Prasinocladus_malaysianus.AAC.1